MSPQRSASKLGDQSGFTLIVVLGVLFVSGLLMTAAFTAAGGDIHSAANDVDAKKAYFAAQAGISNYQYHLNADVNYWTYCTEGAAATNKGLNLYKASPLKKASVSGSQGEEYAIQLLPATTAPSTDMKCDKANPIGTMLQSTVANGGTFRIESTGYSGKEKRTILATFGPPSFLDFLYYTQYETLDPVTYEPAKPLCEKFHEEREAAKLGCQNIEFVSGDVVDGPIHTEDEVSICGNPVFGRAAEDRIEFQRGSTSAGSGCPNEPTYNGTLIPEEEVPQVEPPPSNTSLKTTAELKYSGKTIITLEGETMKVTNNKGATSTVAFPKNGVIYVSNETCSKAYTPYGSNYTEDSGCGNVYIKGKYTGSLTVAAENDIIITGSLTPPVNSSKEPTTNAVLGLIANNFVRVYHPIGSGTHTAESCNAANKSAAEDSNGWGSLPNVEIYAAILAVNHSFIVDNFNCGKPLEKLSVYGAVAQVFRGTVGTHSGSTTVSGYNKNYTYDERFKVESPPFFLNPITASWIVQRQVLAPSP